MFAANAINGVHTTGFSPSSLFGAGQKGGWWDPSDLSTMFSDSGGTTPATVNGLVQRINDKSGNGNNLTCGSGHEPTLRLASGHYYLEFNGTTSVIGNTGLSLSAAMDVMMTAQRATGPIVTWQDSSNSGNDLAGIADVGSGSSATLNSGSPSYAISGAAVPGGTSATRDQLSTAWATATDVVAEAFGLNLTAQPWVGFYLGFYSGFAGLTRCYGIVLRDTLTTQNRSDLLTWLGAKAGLIL